ncbi:unnamed protein product [Thlaspi arvense]|uniref:FBD domain-containing protein n=1 Tax=Thlaspi arvense TaxID=13288 RepID=A0AAU9SUB5_THLAR|nr:unnamed protein product [Thlaspi arvense]
MDRISELSDELLVKILSVVPTKVAVSTSILSKRWEFLWMWVPKLEYNDVNDITDTNGSESSLQRYRDFINKNLPLHRAPIIESLCLRFRSASFRPEDINLWVGIAVSRCVRELSICYLPYNDEPGVALPSSLHTCKSLVTLKIEGMEIIVDVPGTGCLPCLKTLELRNVAYSSEDSLGLLLSCCPVLEDLFIERVEGDNVKALVVVVPSLQRLSLYTEDSCSSDGYVIDTPSLKYFELLDHRDSFSYSIKHMPNLEEAYISILKDLDEFLEAITSVKRLILKVLTNNDEEAMYPAGIVFDQLEHLELCIFNDYWSKLIVRLLNDSPKLRVLSLSVDGCFEAYEWLSNERSPVAKCLLKSLETFEFTGYEGRPEERGFVSFIFKHARRLKSTSILRSSLVQCSVMDVTFVLLSKNYVFN